MTAERDALAGHDVDLSSGSPYCLRCRKEFDSLGEWAKHIALAAGYEPPGSYARGVADGRAEAGPCICNTGPSTDGPDECCPQHGRRVEDWIERGDLLQQRLETAEAERDDLAAAIKALVTAYDIRARNDSGRYVRAVDVVTDLRAVLVSHGGASDAATVQAVNADCIAPSTCERFGECRALTPCRTADTTPEGE